MKPMSLTRVLLLPLHARAPRVADCQQSKGMQLMKDRTLVGLLLL